MARLSWRFWGRLLLLGCSVASQVARAQIRVMSPESLVSSLSASKGRIDGSTATFGAPFYGQRLLGRVVYGEPRSKDQPHCTEADYTVPEPNMTAIRHEHGEVKLLHVIVVRRGGCSFVTKVRIAQQKAAHAVIIVDKEDSELTDTDIRRIIVADDGYGSNIDIPSILIAKAEGQHLINSASLINAQVIVELAWDVPTDHVVTVDMWMSSASQESMSFLREWAPNRRALNDAIKFVPRYHVFSMDAGTQDFNNLCSDRDGQFCAEDPDGSGPVTGAMVLDEDVRQLCIHELYKITRDASEKVGMAGDRVEYAREYWDYVAQLQDQCPITGTTPERTFGLDCSKALMRKVGIDANKVDDCFQRSREAKLKEQRENTAWSPRALRINGWRFTGQLEADLVTRAICAGFIHQPPACKKLTEPVMPVLQNIVQQEGGVTLGSFITALLMVAVFAASAMMCYKRSLTKHIHRSLREEVMLEVQAQMDSYRQMS